MWSENAWGDDHDSCAGIRVRGSCVVPVREFVRVSGMRNPALEVEYCVCVSSSRACDNTTSEGERVVQRMG